MGPHENLTESTTPNNGNQWESGTVKSDPEQVLGNASLNNTIPSNQSSTSKVDFAKQTYTEQESF